MDPSIFAQMLLGILTPFLLGTIKSPTSISKLKRVLPSLVIASNALLALIDAIQGKAPAAALKTHAAKLKLQQSRTK